MMKTEIFVNLINVGERYADIHTSKNKRQT